MIEDNVKDFNDIMNEAKIHSSKRSPRQLTEAEVKELQDLTYDDFNKEKLIDFFCVRYGQSEPRFCTNDRFTLKSGELHSKKTISTTIGKYIFNKFVVPESYRYHLDYYNDELSKAGIGKLEKEMPRLILEDKMSYDDLIETYVNGGEWLGMVMSPFILPSMNISMCRPIPEVIKLRDELFDKYADELSKGDANVTAMVEKQLVELADSILRKSGDPGFSYYDSGCFSFKNNYKKNSIMGGAFVNPSTKEIVVTKSNYADGVSANEYLDFAQLTVVGGQARGVDTQIGGYAQKRVIGALQSAVLDDDGSDCGTKLTMDVDMNAEISNMFLYRYISDNGNKVMLDEDNIKKYYGKTVKLYSPMYCNSLKYCNKCAGELMYKLDMKNIGLTISRYAGTLSNASMKMIHDSSVSFLKMDLEKYIKPL